jgi:hypothetical protein
MLTVRPRFSKMLLSESYLPTVYSKTRFGILMSTLHGANISALRDGITHLLGFGTSNQLKSVRKPLILQHSVALLGFLLSLAYGCTVFETWLSVSSNTVPFPRDTPYEGSQTQMSRQVNQTLCAAFANVTIAPDPNIPSLCGLENARCVFLFKIGYPMPKILQPVRIIHISIPCLKVFAR